MPGPEITQKTGDAPIVKNGHTASMKHGANPNAQVSGKSAPRDLDA